jgi:hypothetical protein
VEVEMVAARQPGVDDGVLEDDAARRPRGGRVCDDVEAGERAVPAVGTIVVAGIPTVVDFPRRSGRAGRRPRRARR